MTILQEGCIGRRRKEEEGVEGEKEEGTCCKLGAAGWLRATRQALVSRLPGADIQPRLMSGLGEAARRKCSRSSGGAVIPSSSGDAADESRTWCRTRSDHAPFAFPTLRSDFPPESFVVQYVAILCETQMMKADKLLRGPVVASFVPRLFVRLLRLQISEHRRSALSRWRTSYGRAGLVRFTRAVKGF